jgi:hypothetical protein
VIMAPKNRIMNANGFSIMRHPIAPIVEQIDVIAQMFDMMFLIFSMLIGYRFRLSRTHGS